MRSTSLIQSNHITRRDACKVAGFALVVALSPPAFGLTLEPLRSVSSDGLFGGVMVAVLAFSALHYARTAQKVFLLLAAVVSFGAWALVVDSPDLGPAFAWPVMAWQHAQALAMPLALWFLLRLTQETVVAQTPKTAVHRWLPVAGGLNIALAVAATWLSFADRVLPFGNLAVLLFILAVGLHGVAHTMEKKKWLPLLAFALLLIGCFAAFAYFINASPWQTAQGVFAVFAVATLFGLTDQQRTLLLDAYQTQLATTENQIVALEKLKSTENALESKVSQRTHELHLAVQRLETLSAQDGLTGVANRRRFDEVLKVECGRAARSRQALSVALIDVDWFGAFNVRYGHESGDACLCMLARVLESGVMRSGDLIARYSGGAFVLLAPDTDANGIFSIANYLCQEVYGLALPNEDSPYCRISISVGVATAYAQEGIGSDRLVQRAAAGLASAKLQGRHRVVAG